MKFRWGISARDEMGMTDDDVKAPDTIDMKSCAAEFIAMTLFVIIGCGVACGNGASDGETRLLVAFAFGMGIMVLACKLSYPFVDPLLALSPNLIFCRHRRSTQWGAD